MRFDRLMEQLVGVLALLILAGGTLLVIAPFITALLWGAILAYCTWHPFQRLTHAFGGRRTLASLLIALLILCVLLGPIFYGSVIFSTNVPDIVALLRQRLAAGAPPFPEWLTRIPYIGPRIDEAWAEIAARNPGTLMKLRELVTQVFETSLSAAFTVIHGLGLLVLSVLFAAVFYVSGESGAAGLRVGMQRIAGARAEYLLD